jgi:hypothetical protein
MTKKVNLDTALHCLIEYKYIKRKGKEDRAGAIQGKEQGRERIRWEKKQGKRARWKRVK